MATQEFFTTIIQRWNTETRITRCRSVAYLLLSVVMLLSGCATSTTFRVVDAETKEPIQGAVALATWGGGRRMGIIAGPTFGYTAKAVEAVSDSEGKFTIPAVTGSLALQTPHLKVYKAGYVGWDSRWIYLGCYKVNRRAAREKEREGFTMKDQDISLEPWKDEYSFISHGSFIAPPTGFEEGGIKDSLYRKAIRYEVPFRVNERNSLKKKGNRMRIFFVCLCIIAGMGSSWSFAFDNEQTHPLLTEKVVEQASDISRP